MTALGTLGDAYSLANAINQLGDIAGDSATGGSSQHAYVWRGGVMMDPGRLSRRRSQTNRIRTRGQIVG
jgi:probable HAF family extracellular repeat protein